MAFSPAPGLIVGDAADLGDRQLWTPSPGPSGLPLPAVPKPAVVLRVGVPPTLLSAPVVPPVVVQPRRSHLVAKPSAAIDYAAELVALKAELFLLTSRVEQLEARPVPLPPRTWRALLHAWWQALQRRWRREWGPRE